jgi:hypothetical protein
VIYLAGSLPAGWATARMSTQRPPVTRDAGGRLTLASGIRGRFRPPSWLIAVMARQLVTGLAWGGLATP